MIVRLALLGGAVLALLSSPASAGTAGSGWTSESNDGYAYVSADRRSITVCDLRDDDRGVDAEYATSLLNIYTVPDPNGPRAGCGTDSTFFSRIDVFKLCVTDGLNRYCHNPIWIKKR
ncbi:hypothetical protein [Nonomuraea soli]|uniref:Uncharacterized protein n=1 Tax=Nonomuraea soli TaxID=1032476 RepID=A0A7W0CUM0_9ACTN|nr:hypothetical protein [Nonomuraea soli]MBA2897646.1 hypothetical protein [Nonomuraea soli]